MENSMNQIIKLWGFFATETRALSRRLLAGENISQDKERFIRAVMDPLDKAYAGLSVVNRLRFDRWVEASRGKNG